jgi:predicted nucleic acid-binding Zn ribbon protein
MPATRKRDKKRQQTQRDTDAPRHAGLKQPSAKLAQLLEWVNLVPPGEQLPFCELTDNDIREQSEILEAISKLPAALQAHLLQLMNRPEQWYKDPNKIAERHLAWSRRRDAAAKEQFQEFGRLVAANNAARVRYRLIVNARQVLRGFAALRGKVQLTVPLPAELILDVDEKRGAFVKTSDPLLNIILGERLDYIRVCPICGRIFFAGRVNQDACPESCADALRQRRKREREKLKKQMAAQRAAKKVRKK